MSQRTLFLSKKVEIAIERLQTFCPPEGYYLCFSGGKDSVVLKVLADLAGVPYEAHFHRTTVDPPEVIRFIKEKHPDVALDRPSVSMFKLIIKNGCPPTRLMRYCCRELKEGYGAGRIALTGIRRSESGPRRAKKQVEQCPALAKTFVHPILEWSEAEVWDFIHTENIDYFAYTTKVINALVVYYVLFLHVASGAW